MGNSNNREIGYRELAASIPGSLISKDDFNLFYSLCKVETVGNLTNILNPSSCQLFYIVISGEIIIQLSKPNTKPITTTIFKSGETIHFFNAKLRGHALTTFEFSEYGECLKNNDIKLSLHYKNIDHEQMPARVIGIDRRGFDEFIMKARTNIHAITSFVNMNMMELFSSSAMFKSMTTEQANMFGPLLKIRLAHTGREIGGHLPIPALKPVERKYKGVFRNNNNNKTKASTTTNTTISNSGHLVMILHGNALSVPSNSNIHTIANALIQQEISATQPQQQDGGSQCSGGTHSNVLGLRLPPTPTSGAPKVFHVSELQKPIDSQDENDSSRGRSHVALPAGIVLCTDQYFVRSSDIRLRTYITSTPSVLGYISLETVDALFLADARFKRVFCRNVLMLMLSWVRYNVPFLADMDDWNLALLSCKVSLIGIRAGEPIKRKGDAGDYAYIVMAGSAKEYSELTPSIDTPASTHGSLAQAFSNAAMDTTDTSAVNTTTNTSVPSTVMIEERVLKWGSMFGVLALTTSQPYFKTVIATEPMLLLRLSKRVLDQIYYNNKTKLCEVRIRLMGPNVDLLHTIDHPTGNELFLKYLTMQRASENLYFYRAVDRYEQLCLRVRKHYSHIQKLIISNITTTSNNNNSSSNSSSTIIQRDIGNNKTILTSVPPPHSAVSQTMTQCMSNKGKMATILSESHFGYQASTTSLPMDRTTGNPDSPPDNAPVHPTEMSVKHKPLHKPHRRQSSFSTKVAVAFAEGAEAEVAVDKGDGEGSAFHSSTASEVGIEDMGEVTLQRLGELRRELLSDHPPDEQETANLPTATGSFSVPALSLPVTHGISIQQQHENANITMDSEDLPHITETLTLHAGAPSLQPTTTTIDDINTGMSTVATTPSPTKIRHHKSSFLAAKNMLSDAAYSYHDQSAVNSSRALSIEEGDDDIDIHSINNHHHHHHDPPYDSTAPPSPGGSISVTNTARTNKNDTDIIQYNRNRRQIARQILSLQKQLFELREVARAIMKTYIYNNAEQQLNLPDYMRIKCETNFKHWCIQLIRAGLEDTNIVLYESECESAYKMIVPGLKPLASSASIICGSTPQSPSHAITATTATTTTTTGVNTNSDMVGICGSSSSNIEHTCSSSSGGTAGNSKTHNISVDTIIHQYEQLDMTFMELFKETKAEILKLLRDDKFPRWKTTADFQSFITSVKPYDATRPASGRDSRRQSAGKDGAVDHNMDLSVMSTTA